ncbi:MAG: HrpE/YscL family type III secretion apparatus protein [Succinivibrio sp.]|nr:HrpE/YscL family type III secretion apparatus protein [Succinivibrio sp.]
MSGYFQLVTDDPHWTVKPGTRILKSADYAELCQANRLLEQVKNAAQEAKKRAEEAYKERYAAGYQDGHEEGKGEYTEKIMETVLKSIDSLEGLESQLVQLVVDSVVKIIGQFEPGDRVLRVVRQALNSVRGSKYVHMRVCSQEEPLVRQQLSSYLVSSDGSSGYINLKADPNLKPGDCVLETEMGVVDSSLSSQLAILRKSLMEHVVRD